MSSDTTNVTQLDSQPAHDLRAADRAVLVIYDGSEQTRVVEVPDGAQLTIGRARSATIVVDSERVSRIHAKLRRKGAEISVEDAGSRNRTWVNGVAIAERRVLVSGDEIVIGPATLLVSVTSRVVARPRVESSRTLDEVLAAEVDRGKRYQRAFSLLMIRIEGELADADAAVDRVTARLRVMDTLVEYAPSEYAIVLPELDASAADATARELVAAARTAGDGTPAHVAVTGGLAAFPEHGTAAGTLLGRARAAVASAHGKRSSAIAIPPEDATPAGVDVVVGDPQMRRVYELVRKVADHQVTVLICGETGVGKEVVAAAIHHASPRRSGPFVRLNCASLPETLLESSLFGYEKGAFTGAERRTRGFFEAAHGGTLFLDEIGEVSLATQAKLLRVLEDHQLTRLGGTEPIAVDVRVVCATNRALDAEVRRGAFRNDLYFRISAFTILVPPLRDRPGEILPLAEHFLGQVSGGRGKPVLSPAAATALRGYAWPGNVRELRNAIERAAVVRSGRRIELDDLPDPVREHAADRGGLVESGTIDSMRDRFAELERVAIVGALEACGGNQTEAAKHLGISRRTLIYRMEKHGLKPQPTSRAAGAD
ncbi:MAG TPA: sigma 54-interacting transcriptional regulator [Kofleriaceae bacterium]|nr:sigma 54-interacting transcriptional regulator [Kofleriaceae bacterium]